MRAHLLALIGIVLALLSLAAGASPALAQRAPQRDAMVHMDLSADPPTYIPDEVNVVPGALVQLMLFGKGPPHSLTLDVAGFEALVPAGTTDGFYERVGEFHAPSAPGSYAFHDRYSAATGSLIVRDAATIEVAENGYELRFAPDRLEVSAGTAITWMANGSFAHTLTPNATGAWDDAKLALQPGQQATFLAPTTPGEYAFHCRYHAGSGMVGVLVVRAAGPNATPDATPSANGTESVSATPPPRSTSALPQFVVLSIVVALAFMLGRSRGQA